MGRVGPSNTAALIRASQYNGPWLTMGAASASAFRKACVALGVQGTRAMNKAALRRELLKFPQGDVKRALGWTDPRELTDAEREEMCNHLRRNGFL